MVVLDCDTEFPNLKRKSFLPNKIYDFYKLLVQLILPGLGSLYFILSILAPYEATPGFLAGLLFAILFHGIILFISSKRCTFVYSDHDGDLVIKKSHNTQIFSLELKSDPNDLVNKESIVFKVRKDVSPSEDLAK